MSPATTNVRPKYCVNFDFDLLTPKWIMVLRVNIHFRRRLEPTEIWHAPLGNRVPSWW